jgi:hypothetical protein
MFGNRNYLRTGSGIFLHSSQYASFLKTHPYFSRHGFLDVCWIGLSCWFDYFSPLNVAIPFLTFRVCVCVILALTEWPEDLLCLNILYNYQFSEVKIDSHNILVWVWLWYTGESLNSSSEHCVCNLYVLLCVLDNQDRLHYVMSG